MIFSFLHHSENKSNEAVNHSLVLPHHPEDYSMEGSEFIDDAIRMVEQPLKTAVEETSETHGFYCS